MKRILVVDDHTSVRKGIAALLESSVERIEVAEASRAEEALQLVGAKLFDLVILDLSMPGMGGLAAIEALRTSRFGPRILVLSMHPAESLGLRTLRAGANGYVAKGATRSELLKAVNTVMQGGNYVTPGLAERILDLDSPASPSHDRLSAREFRVMHLLARGCNLSEVANELGVSAKTVSTYRRRVLEKLELDSTAAIVRYCLEHRLIE